MFSSRFSSLMAAMLLGASLHAQAAVVTFNDIGQFSGAAQAGVAVDRFGGLPAFERVAGPAARQAGTTGYRASVINLAGIDDVGAEDLFTLDGGAGSTWLSTNFPRNAIRFDQFGGTVHAIGGVFFATDFDGAALAGRTMVLTLFHSAGVLEALIEGSRDAFFGFVTDGQIHGLSVRVLGDAAAGFATVGALAVAVPEPASLALLAAGLILLCAQRRRR